MVFTLRGKVKRGGIVFPTPLELPEDADVSVRISSDPQEIEVLPLWKDEFKDDDTPFEDLTFFGMWADREDMADSVEWVSKQRDRWTDRLYRKD